MILNSKKYPKTWHVPWSTGTSDDKTLDDDNDFKGLQIVQTLKMDGENTSIYRNGMHARSMESANHPSQSWVKQLAGQIGWQLDDETRICGENLYALHTVPYTDLESYFMLFSVWTLDECWNWQDTKKFADYLRLITVPVIYEGVYDPMKIIEAFQPYKESHEGYVIRNQESFQYKDFKHNVAKFVNPGFRQTLKQSTVHWASAPVVPNKLKK